MTYVLLIIGFAMLIKGAEYFVDGASGIARVLKVSPMLIGLTICAFGTSSPELVVGISSALKGENALALGNVIGANIFTVTLVVGISALISPLKVEKETVKKEIPFAVLATIILLVMTLDVFLKSDVFNILSVSDGIILLLLFVIFINYLLEMAKLSREKIADSDETLQPGKPLSSNVLYTVGGLVILIIGGEIVVRNAVEIAEVFGMSPSLIGLTVVSIGTALPELITSIVAALKKQSDIAVGNVIGSNIFNILMILGISSIISPIEVTSVMYIYIGMLVFVSVLLWLLSSTNHKISKKEGLCLLVMYVVYFAYTIISSI